MSCGGVAGRSRAKVDDFSGVTWSSHERGLKGRLEPVNLAAAPVDLVSSFVEQFLRFADVITAGAEPDVDALQAASTQKIVEWGYSNRRSLMAPVTRGSTLARPSLDPAPTVVTGGSGFLGTHLLERLCEMGFENVVVPVRSYRSGANAARFPVNRVLTNLLDRQSVAKCLKGAKYVFHLAYGTDGVEPARVTREGTKNVVEAALEAGVEALVCVSTASVFGHPKTNHPIDETFPYRPSLGEYGKSKADAEKYVLQVARATRRMRMVVVNPAAIYGPNGRLFVEYPLRAAMAKQFAWIDEGCGKLNYVFVKNVVDALILAARIPEAHGQNFIICDGVCTFRQFLTPLLGEMANTLPSYSRADLVRMEREVTANMAGLAKRIIGCRGVAYRESNANTAYSKAVYRETTSLALYANANRATSFAR